MNLKDRAIYQLPNGRELVACRTCDNETLLFSVSATESGLYELNSEGRLLLDGRLTAWERNDLLETGRLASLEVTSIVEERFTKGRDTSKEQSI
jgi:hypothetical protein